MDGRKAKGRQRLLAVVCASVFVAALCGCDNAEDAEMQSRVLSKFYQAVYVTADLKAMESCLFEEYRYYFENAVTMAGMEPEYYESYRQEAVKLLGEGYTVDVEIKKRAAVDQAKLSELRNVYEGIAAADKVTYDIVFVVDGGEKRYENTLYMVKVEGEWYMSTHLTLPVGTNVYAY